MKVPDDGQKVVGSLVGLERRVGIIDPLVCPPTVGGRSRPRLRSFPGVVDTVCDEAPCCTSKLLLSSHLRRRRTTRGRPPTDKVRSRARRHLPTARTFSTLRSGLPVRVQ